MQRILLAAAVLLAASGTARAAGPRQHHYVGVHPIPKVEGTGFCYIEVPHVHVYAVARADKVQYRDHGGDRFFVGDPVAYGYDGPKVAYKGHHPIQVDAVVEADVEVAGPEVVFCYLDGPHYHAFGPVEGPDFKLVGGAYFYVGTPPPVYVEARPAMVAINAIYTPLVYVRPVVTVAAPVGWIGARVDVVGPAVVAPEVEVRAPSMRLGVGVDVGVGIGVGVGAGVGVGVGGPVVIGGQHGKYKRHKHKKFKRGKWKH